MYSTLKAAAVICCSSWVFAGSASADQTPPMDLNAATAQKKLDLFDKQIDSGITPPEVEARYEGNPAFWDYRRALDEAQIDLRLVEQSKEPDSPTRQEREKERVQLLQEKLDQLTDELKNNAIAVERSKLAADLKSAADANVAPKDQGDVDSTPSPDRVRWWYVEKPQDGQDKKDGKDNDGRRGPMGPGGRMGPMDWGFRVDGDSRGQKQPKGLVLGIAAGNPDPALTSQLNLPDGVGLVVEQVLPNSAAQRAGIEQYDVLKMLDDQLVVNVEQVGVLIRMHKPGDEITLTLIRHGKTKEVTATLGQSNQRPGRRDDNRPRRQMDNGMIGPDNPLRSRSYEGPKSGDNSTPDTSGTPASPPPPPPHKHKPPKPKDDDEDSGFTTPAPSTQPAELQAAADAF